MTDQGWAANSGSCPTGQAPSGLVASRGDPGRDAAPPAYQAEVLRQQVCDDVNRRFWRARQRLLRAFDGRKDQVQRDYEKLSAPDFLAKYAGWRFL